jgi:transposase
MSKHLRFWTGHVPEQNVWAIGMSVGRFSHRPERFRQSYRLLLSRPYRLRRSPWHPKSSRFEGPTRRQSAVGAVYLLKEDLRLFWQQPSKEEAECFVSNWIDEALSLRNQYMTTLARILRRRLPGILAWYDHPFSTGPLEGLNNKIKVMKGVAYGYRDARFFMLRLLFLHETKLRLSGT